MARFPLRINWTSKPPIGTPLRTDGHWSVQDLLICSVFNEGGSTPLELVNGKWMPITYGTGTSSQWSPDGLQLISNVTTNASPTVEYVSIGSTKCLSVVEGSVVQVVKNLGATSGDQGTFQAGATHRRWILHQTTNASTFNLTIVLASGVYKYIASAVPRNITIVQGMTWRNGGENGAGYINGKAGVIWAGAAVQTEVFASMPLHGNCEHDFLATYSKSLTTDQMASISANPWQVFSPEIIWVELGGGVTPIILEGLLSGSSTVNADLLTAITLAGVNNGSGSASANLTTAITMAGSSSGTGTASADLTTVIALAGQILASGSTAAALSTAIPLSGSSRGAATASADLTTAIRLAAVAAGMGTISGELAGIVAIILAGVASGSSSASGALVTAIPLAGTVDGTASTTAQLATAITLAGAAHGDAEAQAALTTAIALAGEIVGHGSATAILTAAVQILIRGNILALPTEQRLARLPPENKIMRLKGLL